MLAWLGGQIDTAIALMALALSIVSLWRSRAKVRAWLTLRTLSRRNDDGTYSHEYFPMVKVSNTRGVTGIDFIEIVPVAGVPEGISYGYSVIDMREVVGARLSRSAQEIFSDDPSGTQRVLADGEIATWTYRVTAPQELLDTPHRIVARVHLASGKVIESNSVLYPLPAWPNEDATTG